jgi:hypothetical protein
MITITFRDRETVKKVLGFSLGRFSGASSKPASASFHQPRWWR